MVASAISAGGVRELPHPAGTAALRFSKAGSFPTGHRLVLAMSRHSPVGGPAELHELPDRER